MDPYSGSQTQRSEWWFEGFEALNRLIQTGLEFRGITPSGLSIRSGRNDMNWAGTDSLAPTMVRVAELNRLEVGF
jgi:hypothetical protein